MGYYYEVVSGQHSIFFFFELGRGLSGILTYVIYGEQGCRVVYYYNMLLCNRLAMRAKSGIIQHCRPALHAETVILAIIKPHSL